MNRRLIHRIKLLKIDGSVIIAPKQMSSEDIIRWYKREEGLSVERKVTVELVSLTDKLPDATGDYAAAVEASGFDPERAESPIFL